LVKISVLNADDFYQIILQNDTLRHDTQDKTDKDLKKEKSRKAYYKEFQKVCSICSFPFTTLSKLILVDQ